MTEIINKVFDEERALYNLRGALVRNCAFDGPADGESALKESGNLQIQNCAFMLRYPLWHCRDISVFESTMGEGCRAAAWYVNNARFDRCTIDGIKCLRESKGIVMRNCTVNSKEFGWRCLDLDLCDCTFDSEYFLFECGNVNIKNVRMRGKYSFQYVRNMTMENCDLDTKDAFWHVRNVTVKNSVLKGEYLGWYSEGLTLIGCRIIGTQPLCYCKNLVLIDCEMIGTDLSFEYSEVDAQINGRVLSVKNPASGRIVADGYDAIVLDDPVIECTCRITARNELP